ncbi:MAG: RHS repeat-associated core domain-containing protein, partial [Clostridia bacterium]|nr:RHS repeat-associated core domain-containing protein [Clostridia bacterium]
PLGLLATKRICCGRGSTYVYTYDTDGNGNTLLRFKKVRYSLDPDNFSEREYTYDERGNILTQKVTSTSYYDDPTLGNYSMYYTYDQNNRLVSEVKKLTGSEGEGTLWQKTYTYDQSGRLSTVVENDGNGNVMTCYLYDSAGRVVKATVGNQEVNYTYDVAGNLLSATGDTDKPFSCAWSKGGLLTGVTVNGVTTSYAYDHQNIRIGKTGTTDKNYFVDGTKIIAENIGTTQRLVYFYDGDSLVGFKLHDGPDLIYPKATLEDGYCYQYVCDEQNNVIGLTDCVGTLVARYEYDAWGNHKVLDANGVVNADPNFIGNLNPFRYRGYYYDVETGLYYCNARYYSPLLRRWISPDAFSYLDPKTFCGIDLYCYCKNNPIMFIDPSGRIPLIWMFVIFIGCVAAGAVSYGVVFYRKGNRGWDLAKAVILGTFIGLAAAGLIISATAMFVVAATQSLSVCVFGFLTAKQVAAIGFLAYDFTAFIIAPLYGITMEGIEIGNTNSEYKPPEPKVVPPYLS